MKRICFISLVIIICFSCHVSKKEQKAPNVIEYKTEQDTTLNKVAQFVSKTGEPLGTLYTKKHNGDQNVFQAAYIMLERSGKRDTVYSIEGTSLRNKNGVENFPIREDEFYGYKLIFKAEDYFEFILLGDSGRDVSDNIHVHWNDTQKIFEV